jgi:hypothetical protein
MQLPDTKNSTEDSFSASRQKILGEIYQSYEDYHVYPHMALIPDWFLRYWDLAEMCFEAYGLEMPHKPRLTTKAEVDAVMGKINKADDTK